MIVTTDESASVKLLTASNVIAIEFVKTPNKALAEAKRILANIPTMLVLTIIFSLVAISTFSGIASAVTPPATNIIGDIDCFEIHAP